MRFNIRNLFERLLRHHGPQSWWPADDPFEVMVGAVLVQRTNWHNAALGIAALKDRNLLRTTGLIEVGETALQACIKAAGFYRTKAARLKTLAQFVEGAGGIEGLRQHSTPALRQQLLALNGIGPETADVILLYAFARPVVVIDDYLRRLWRRVHGLDRTNDDELRAAVFAQLCKTDELNELHALVVANSKTVCRKVPVCGCCCLRETCQMAAQARCITRHGRKVWASLEN